MAVFQYRAWQGGVKELEGSLVAETPRHARDLLREQGLVVTGVSEVRERGSSSLRTFFRKARRAEVADFIRELSTLLAVGVPLVGALDTILRGRKGRFRTVLLSLRDRVSGGLSLAEAMRESPGVFDDMVRNVCRVGEESGNLEEALSRLSDYLERAERLRGRVSSALIYPGIVLVMALLTSVLLMTVVVPSILEPLVSSGARLPLVTRIVQAGSTALLEGWWILVLSGLGVSGALGAVLRTDRGRLAWHALSLRLPLVGDMARKQAIVRVAVVLATLLRSGVVFLEAIATAKESARNLVVRRALEESSEAVASGKELGESLDRTGVFPPTVVQVFSLGEESGRLDDMLDRLASDYDHQVHQKSQRLASALEPLVILLLALMVGLIAFATILPILEAGHVF